ncbi:hypothetical protein J3998_03025 [Thiomicrorhabdus sp. 6S2-11]|uniref:Curli production assembly/transport component CsgG n=1 Tax=Thiomicrorhabdus marina TaxID=2818442 RepID=A0ABS3Q2K4_9GAMM|nr:CsgG/HfaB family protein [Thiomicrorhabdus marina]MBO1926537.1 hypothetical protein [Thiomicrorhabdus marina]
MKIKTIFSVLTATIIFSGCVSTQTKTSTQSTSNGVESEIQKDASGKEYKIVKTYQCASPVAKISVSELKCKTAQCQPVAQGTGNMGMLLAMARTQNGQKDLSNLGPAMSTMLTSSLNQSGCFEVLDRESLEELKRELALAGKTMQIDSADLIMTGSITALNYEKKKSTFGGGLIPLAGAFTNTTTTAKLDIDMRLMDVNSSRVVYTKTYKSNAENDNYGFGALGFGGGAAAGGAMSFGGDLELEKAVRSVINQSVADLIQSSAKGAYTVKEQRVDVD